MKIARQNAHLFPLPCSARHAGGFSLLELLMIMIILGVLAAVAGPRMFQATPFGARATADDVTALLRYTQQLNMNFAAGAVLIVDSGAREFRIEREATVLRFPGASSDGVSWPSGVSVSADCNQIGFTRRGDVHCGGVVYTAAEPPIQLQIVAGSSGHAVCLHPVTGFAEVHFGAASCS